MLELHGAPGSQNGEIHSGCVTGPDRSFGGKPIHYFDTEWNRELAIRAIDEMAKYGKSNSNFWGLGVLNEPQPGVGVHDYHTFISDFYELATLKARETLDAEVPILLFSWNYDFNKWKTGQFSDARFGNIVWGTHIYLPDNKSVDALLNQYDSQMKKVTDFSARMKQDSIIGEFCLAACTLDEEDPEFKRYAKEIWDKFSDSQAAILWNFDCQYTKWSFKDLN